MTTIKVSEMPISHKEANPSIALKDQRFKWWAMRGSRKPSDVPSIRTLWFTK